MRRLLTILMLVACYLGIYAQGGYNPADPPNPQEPETKYALYCEVVPNGTGSLNIWSGKYAKDATVSLTAYNYSNYRFVCWMNDNDTISKNASFTFTMPAKQVRLVAVFKYDPTSPANPDAPTINPDKGSDVDPTPEIDPYNPSSPSNPGTNKFDSQTGIVIIDDFTAGSLRSAINTAITGYSSNDVRQIIVQGTINSNDFSAASDYSNCTCIDFSRCPSLTSVPSYTYYGNTTLEQIILPSSVESIGAHAFENATKLTEITCYATTPPAVGTNAFTGLSSSAVAYVPQKSISAYQAAEGWSSLTLKEAKNQYAVDFTVTDITFGTDSFAPKGEVTLNWTVNNEGESDSSAGWKEAIYLTDDNGTSPLLYTLYYNNTLAAGKNVQRSATFTLPDILGVSGDVKAKVVVSPSSNAGESVQAQANNAGISTTTANLKKVIYLSSATSYIQEGTSGIAVTAKRSGNCSTAETLSLKATPDSLTNINESVSFSKGNNTVRFIVSVPDNSTVNGIDSIYVTASGSDYDAVTLPIAFEDNDTYPLSLKLDKSTYAEGDTIHATISIGTAVEKDLPITLNVEHTKRFKLPNATTIKQGQKSVEVDIPVLDDDVPSNDEGVEIKASAEGYDVASAMFILTDDDVPAIEMTLTPSTVSENAGSEAIHAVITRQDVVNNKITLRLTDDGNGDIFYDDIVTMDKGVTEVTIPIGVKDNVKAEGSRDINITASIYISTCNCSAQGTKQSVVTKTITVLDNDGPTLSLSADKAVIIEGDTKGATFTVSRNNDTTNALPVQLSVDAADIVLPTQVTIPPGSEKTTFTLYAKSNSTQEGNRVVNVKAQCDGYTMGAAYVLVTDQTLPDISIESLSVNPTSVDVNQKYTVSITVKNVGAAEMPARSTVTLKTDNEELTLTFPEAIGIGEPKTLTAELTAPAVATTCHITATCNANNAIAELQTINNSTSATIEVTSPFTMTISADKNAYNIGDVVHLTGKVTSRSQSVANVKIEPYVMYLNARTALEAVTAKDGSFSLDYTLPQGIGGDFTIGACLPGEESEDGMATIGVYGMARTSSSYFKLHVYKDEPYKLSVSVKNLSSLPLTGITTTVEDESGHYKVDAGKLSSISGNGQEDLNIKITSSALSTSNTWERVMITLTSAEGAKMSFPIYCYCASHDGVLALSTQNISTTITKDTPRVFPVILTNSGMGETGKITVDIPSGQSFVSLASSPDIQSLETGDSATVMLKFNPAGLDVNVIQKGSIAINCENADGVSIAYSLKVVSEDKGNLYVRVMDENTEYGNAKGEHPYVANATVKVKDYNSGVTLYTGTSDTDGYARFENINEGAYTIYVTASKHDSYTQNVMVNPGETTEHTAYVSYQAISVSFDVEETTVEDEYDITSKFVYETQVPVPVVEMDSPEEIDLQKVVDGGTLLYNVVLTNKGLINANNVCLSLPEANGVDFIALNEYSGLTLAPGQTYTVPVYVSLAQQTPAKLKAIRRKEGGSQLLGCSGETCCGWSYPCSGNDKAEKIAEVVKFLLKTCKADSVKTETKTKKVEITEPDPPTKKYPEADPKIPYATNKTQIDLYSMYVWSCRIFCSMACAFGEDEISWDLAKCVWDNATGGYGAKRANAPKKVSALQSLYENYKEKYDLLIALDSLSNALQAEIVNAPELKADTTTYNKVYAGITQVNNDLMTRHSAGTLYTQTAQQLYDENIGYMPQKMADWYDFSLSTYIERQVNTYRRADGLSVTGNNYVIVELAKRLQNQIDSCEAKMKAMGFVDTQDLLQSVIADGKELSESSANTCASVKFQINQQLVLTRQAFRGTMTIENSSNNKLSNVSAAITATNSEGVQATAHEMQISLESTNGFTDNGDGTWSLEAGATGTATYLFIPTKYAAPTTDETYSFGGSLYFNDGDQDQARSLYPCSLVVRPTPELDLTYFMQRDLYGDNPLTPDVKEPVIPAEFTVLIHNKGMGDAQSVKMITHQPEVIDNEKGLAVDFSIVSSSLNGQNKSLTLATDIATDFGAIPAGTCSYATWDLTSSLLGHFKDYSISYTHVTSYDNPDLSLLDNVTIHELIHSINTNVGGTTYRAWVTNDVADTHDLPDHIYFANGTDETVHPMPDAATVSVASDNQCRVTVNAVTNEWIYTNVDNPVDKSFKISKITNANTDEELDPESFWTTEYTMVDGKDPVEENKLHLVVLTSGAGEVSYIIDFDTTAVVEGIKEVTTSIDYKTSSVYTISGIKVADSTDAETLHKLPNGVYIVNRRKFIKR